MATAHFVKRSRMNNELDDKNDKRYNKYNHSRIYVMESNLSCKSEHDALVDFFATYEVMEADTPELLAQVAQVRHIVFCQELGYDMDTQNQQERDEYDANSIHILLRKKEGSDPTGTLRIVLPGSAGETWLPFEHYGVPHVDRSAFDLNAIDKASSIEFSRLALVQDSRQSAGAMDRQSSMFLGTAIYLATLSRFLEAGHENAFITIEPRLNRLLSRNGIHFQQISPTFEYFGKRATYYTNRQGLANDLRDLRPDMRLLYNGLEKQRRSFRSNLCERSGLTLVK